MLALLLMLILTACRGPRGAAPEAAGLAIDISPNTTVVGETVLEVSISGADGEDPPLLQSVTVRGDMNHAGMVPVLGEADLAGPQPYEIPFEWTMGGDWFVTVTATLENGDTIEQVFDLSIDGPGPDEMEDMDSMDMSEDAEDSDMEGMDMSENMAATEEPGT